MNNTILIVDDDEMTTQLFSIILEKEGFCTKVASQGNTVLKDVALIQPDVMLLDIRLPDLDGLDICRTVRQSAPKVDLPIIIITASSDSKTKQAALAAGANLFMSKPISPLKMINHVKALMLTSL